MEKERISITFEVDLDPLPGACHTLEYWVQATEQDFKRFPWYNPKITDSRVVKEAPPYMDQIKRLATEVLGESAISIMLDKIDVLMNGGVTFTQVQQWADVKGIPFETAIEELYVEWVKNHE